MPARGRVDEKPGRHPVIELAWRVPDAMGAMVEPPGRREAGLGGDWRCVAKKHPFEPKTSVANAAKVFRWPGRRCRAGLAL